MCMYITFYCINTFLIFFPLRKIIFIETLYDSWLTHSFPHTAALVEDLLKTPVVRIAGAGWSSWETWSSCSQSCAKGYRTRRRTCATAEGKSSPVSCRGSPIEYQDCNIQACPGESKNTVHVCLQYCKLCVCMCVCGWVGGWRRPLAKTRLSHVSGEVKKLKRKC